MRKFNAIGLEHIQNLSLGAINFARKVSVTNICPIFTEYERLVSRNYLHYDENQLAIIRNFSALRAAMSEYEKAYEARISSSFSLFYRRPLPPKGLYLHGDVGMCIGFGESSKELFV